MASASVERVVQILDFLTTHAGRGFTPSELSRRLNISKATAHVVVSTLNERALLSKLPDTNNYRLGPALIPMGAVAERDFPALAIARQEATQLAEDFDSECLILLPSGREVLVAARVGIPSLLTADIPEGARQPMIPPIGSTVVAWSYDLSIEEWLDRAEPELAPAIRDHYRRAIEAIRQRGYAVGARVPTLYELNRTYADADLYTPNGRQQIAAALSAVADEPHYLPAADDLPPDTELSHVSAPVYGPDEALLFTLSLIPSSDHRAAAIPTLARAVLRSAGVIMTAVQGRQPRGAVRRVVGAVAM